MTESNYGTFIIDEHSEIFEIVDGRRLDREDGYVYDIDDAKTTVSRIGSGGFVTGEFTAHATLEDLQAAINSGPSL
jgi:hypothetical protein